MEKINIEQFSEQEIQKYLASGQHEPDFRVYYGDELYEELRSMTLELAERESSNRFLQERNRKKVYILPGILGSRLSVRKTNKKDLVWIDPIGIIKGHITKIKYAPARDKVFGSGAISLTYARMKYRLRLAGFDAQYLPFDWRKPAYDTGAKIYEKLKADGDTDVTLVCHSMGGLVARRIAELDGQKDIVSRVITLGTPNRGSYAPFEVLRLVSPALKNIAKLDLIHTERQIAHDVLRGFPGLLEMLPSEDMRETNLFDLNIWPKTSGVRPTKTKLTKAQANKRKLVAPDDRFIQVVGMNEQTVQSVIIRGEKVFYNRDMDGDGTVPRDLAEMGDIPRYYYDGKHGSLPGYRTIIKAVKDLIRTGATDRLRRRAQISSMAAESFRPSMRILETNLRAETTAKARAMSTTPNIADLLSEFVGRPETGMDDNQDTPPMRASAIIDVDDEFDGVGQARQAGKSSFEGYPIERLIRAAEVWEKNSKKRNTADKAVKAGRLADVDTPKRTQAYMIRNVKKSRILAGAQKGIIAPPELIGLVEPGFSDVELFGLVEEVSSAITAERIIGPTEDFLSVLFLKRGPIVAKSIGRIVDRYSEFGFGTGFMIAPGVMITNNHVFRSGSDANQANIEFDFELNLKNRNMLSQRFTLLPDKLFYTSKDLDFSVVAVGAVSDKGRALSDYGFLPLDGQIGKIIAGKPVNIIQHPAGRRKQVVFRKSHLKALPEDANDSSAATLANSVLHYSGDTLRGSSGAAVYNDNWEVVALHHSAVPERNAAGHWRMKDDTFMDPDKIINDDDIKWVANEGIRVSRIVANLKAVAAENSLKPSAQRLVESVLKIGKDVAESGIIFNPLPNSPDERINISENQPTDTTGSASGGNSEFSIGSTNATANFGTTADIQVGIGAGHELDITIPLKISITIGEPGLVNAGDNHLSGGDISGGGAPVPDLEAKRKIAQYADRIGYDRNFLGRPVSMPILQNTIAGDAAQLLGTNETELKYDHFSVIMSKDRRLAYVSAGNFDAAAPVKPTRDKEPWSYDPRIDKAFQAGNAFYKSNDLDRGHLFRRTDGSWGDTMLAALRADADTYHWTNIGPQHKVFNRSNLEKEWLLWGQLENHVTKQAGIDGSRYSIFNGPVFNDDIDPVHRGLLIPRAYWKIVVYSDAVSTKAHAFIIGQEALVKSLPLEAFEVGEFGVYQVKIKDLENRTQLDFGGLSNGDRLESISASESFLGRRPIVRISAPRDIII
ncbi:MAG: DNA/RNA non-specific endonuclease [Robiginitomaculum sp.]|nr:DNA/RNA non-specific endonuclease [Robiginitomaculum sp.]